MGIPPALLFDTQILLFGGISYTRCYFLIILSLLRRENVVVGGVTAPDKQGVYATVNCEASAPSVTENCGRVTISYFHIVTARVSSTFCDSLYHLL